METDFNSKYSGEQVEELLDQVASGGTGGGESAIYIWEFNGSLEDGASGTIEREVLEKLAEAKSVWLRREESYTVCNEHVGDSSSLFMLFTTIQQDIMSNCAITIDGETLQYNVAVYEISIQDAIFDLEDIRSGAEKGATALQKLPSEAVIHNEDGAVITQRGILVDDNVGMWYALPFTDDADKENADAILAWYTLNGELILQRGILVDNNEGHRYALPYASDEDKAGADSVIASERYVDDEIAWFDGVAVEPLWAELDKKQPTLVSGENIKTINGKSILGSGNIEISSGGGSSGSGAYAEINHGTSDTTFTLAPNTFHVWEEVTSLTLTLGTETSGIANEYLFQFTSGATPTTLTLPSDIKFSDDLVIEANKIYQISILKGLGSVLTWNPTMPIIYFSIDSQEFQAEQGMTWMEWINSEYNTIGCVNDNFGTVLCDMGRSYIYGVNVNDTIIPNNNYTKMQQSGGGAS